MEDDRFEIELTPIGEHRPQQVRGLASSATTEPPLDPLEGPQVPEAERPAPGWLGTEQRRLVTAAAVAATVALLLGWMLGRAGSEESTIIEGAETSSEAVEESSDSIPDLTLSGADLLPRVSTTAPRRTTTTTLFEIETGTMAIDQRLAGEPIEFVGWAHGQVVEVDLSTGATRTIPVDTRRLDPAFLRVGPDWVLISSFEGSRYLVGADGSVEQLGFGDPWEQLWIPGTDRFWRLEDEPGQGTLTFFEVTLDGQPTGGKLTIPEPTYGWVGDPAGGILTVVTGGVYAIDATEAVLIGRGDLVTVDVQTAVLRTCDERLTCGYLVVDRATGASRELFPVDDEGVAVELEASALGWWPWSALPFSPDGHRAVVIASGAQEPVLALLDLDSGHTTPLAGEGFESLNGGTAFSADGRYVFFLDDGTPHALAIGADDPFPVFIEAVSWQAFGARSS